MTDLRVESRGATIWLTIDREARRNAFTTAVLEALIEALDRADRDPEIRAIVLTGAGDRAFCAGADISAESDQFRYDFSKTGVPLVRLFERARALTTPLIARVNGHALAGGLGLLGMCDMAVAVETALFGMPEVKVGLFPMQIMCVLEPLVPRRKLYELAITGEPVSAREALEIGLLNYVVPAAELDTKLDWLLNRVIDKSPTAIRRGKYAMRRMESMHADQAFAFMEAQIGLVSLTEDAAEGRRAFNEKRPPRWTGR
ncbi:MAG TPA: enoyl-CoA hydratase-related protein [Acetobacteraceae bacterium]|jgi:enoyl-CoA hydratase/carnithine racemase|nr:enoyl-CoA hydratase-related protein [Acetobacteraceae bacterium]